MAKPKQTSLFRPVFEQAAKLTWRAKSRWLAGLSALMLGSFMGYQLILQGVQSLAQPSQWWQRWSNFAAGQGPIDLIWNQFGILFSDPQGWLSAVLVWLIIGAIFAVAFALSVFLVSSLVSAVKLEETSKIKSFIIAMRESVDHFWRVLGVVLLSQLAVNVLILLFSIPVIWFGVQHADTAYATPALLTFFLLFLVASFIVVMISWYAMMFIIVDEEKIPDSITLAAGLLRKHWVITLEMFLLQILLAIIIISIVLLAMSLVTIPVVIVGLILVARGFFDITVYLPQVLITVLALIGLVTVSAYNVFYVYSWTYLFLRFEEVKPKSRIADWIERKLMA